MITRIELLQNWKYRVETIGVGMPSLHDTLGEAKKEAKRLQNIFGGSICLCQG